MLQRRYKKYAPWPVVLWCRLMRHRGQPQWGQSCRCLRCGDPVAINPAIAEEMRLDGLDPNVVQGRLHYEDQRRPR